METGGKLASMMKKRERSLYRLKEIKGRRSWGTLFHNTLRCEGF